MLGAAHAALQYRLADPVSAESVLRGFLDLLDDLALSPNEALSAQSIAAERTITLARLERLRMKSGDPDTARYYFELALESCRAARWNDCSRDGLARALDDGGAG